MDSLGLVTTGVKINIEKNSNTDRTRLPKVNKKESFLKLKPSSQKPHHSKRQTPLTNPEFILFKEPPNTIILPTNLFEDHLFTTNYIKITNSRITTTSRNLRNSVQLSPKQDPSPDFLHDFTIEGIQSPTHRKVLKKPEILNLPKPELLNINKPRIPLVKKLNKSTPHNESSVKEIMYWNWIGIIKASNGFEIYPHHGQFKYYVGKGNNGSLVNHILKSRFWWTRTDNVEDANFVWTQLKNKQVLDLIPKFESRLEKDLNPVVFDSKIPKAILNENQENFGFKLISESYSYLNLTKGYFLVPETLKSHNRLPNNSCICNKKGMFKNLKAYYDTVGLNIFSKVPLTFHIETGTSDLQFQTFTQQFTEGSTWIIKPGEATNRGKGIKVSSSLDQIKEIINKHQENRTYIIQKYIQNPLLINKRKFDIRCYALITSFANQLQGYFFKDGYLRTSCKEFNIKNTNDKFIHLTNDAIQKNHEDYGKFESGNKLSYYDFQKFLHSNGSNVDFFIDIFPQIVDIVKESIACAKDIINEECKMNAFEVLGYDFMVDSEYKVWLIEINTNPCLELSCSYLSKIIPDMLENSFRIALDPMFPPPEGHKKFKMWVKNSNLTNKYMLVYSSLSAN
ncbi:hypothetical protein SteCoe_25864 [Stentor coeruleus]|uniref:Tubulin-tyrosine ligase family protein n=1 Tax=Stentor coeruleus TaxID=5963 RepID=A0A1R2BE94_9CILI|nr:hypothetical protein SteCoe_25864 [Stentor coeruleus]